MYNKMVQYGRESAHKSRAQGAPSSLGVYMYVNQHISKEENETSAGPERSQLLQILPSLTAKEILQRLRLLFLLRQHWQAPSFSCAPMFL
jgi:hypothetical protein